VAYIDAACCGSTSYVDKGGARSGFDIACDDRGPVGANQYEARKF